MNNIFTLISGVIKDEWIELPTKPAMGICAVTGKKTLCIPRGKLMSSNFTAQPILSCPSSNFISIEAYQTLKYRPERMSSWIVSKKEFKKLKRVDIRPFVLNGVQEKTWAGYVTTSYKKHGALKAVINHGRRAIWAFDEALVDCSDKEKVNSWYNRLVAELKKGFGRTTLETLYCPPYILRKVGMIKWIEFETWAKSKYKSNLYKFLCYLLPSQAELKEQKGIRNGDKTS